MTHPLKKLPHCLNNAVNSVEEEIWQVVRIDDDECDGLSKSDKKLLSLFVLKLLNKTLKKNMNKRR